MDVDPTSPSLPIWVSVAAQERDSDESSDGVGPAEDIAADKAQRELNFFFLMTSFYLSFYILELQRAFVISYFKTAKSNGDLYRLIHDNLFLFDEEFKGVGFSSDSQRRTEYLLWRFEDVFQLQVGPVYPFEDSTLEIPQLSVSICLSRILGSTQ